MTVCCQVFEGNWNTCDEDVRAKALQKADMLPEGALISITESRKSAVYSAYPGAARHDSYLCITVYWREK